MASREASLKVTLQPASFQAGLRRMGSMTATAGKQMGAALKGPMVAGLKAARSEISGMVSGLKSGIKVAATLGGALSFGAMAKDALTLQNTYRNIAFNVNKISTNSQTWEDIQKMITGAVMNTGRSADELSDAFSQVFEATGDFEYARKSMQLVGETATATGHSTQDLANVMQMSYRKFGTGMEDAEEAMARFVGLTGTGGAGLSDMTGKFALMAGEASNAGMEGTAGISQMLGMLQLLDSSIGEKAVPGLKMMFQAVKGGSSQFLMLEKAMKRSGVAFEPDMTAMDKILATLQTAKGRKAGEQVFTADARVVYDELAKPFDEAMEKALAAGLSKKGAMDAGIAAFNKNLEDAAKSSLEYSDILKEARDRAEKDPLVKMNKALAKIAEAFSQPKMIDAMNKLANKLPAFADAIADVINYILDNPWDTIAMVVAAKVGMAFAGAAVSKAVAGGMARLLGGQAAAAGVSAAAATAGTGGAAMAGGAAAGRVGLMAGLGTVATAGAGAIAGTVGAGLAVGGAAGYVGYKYMGGESGQQAEMEAHRGARSAISMAGAAAGGGNEKRMSDAIMQLATAKQSLDKNQSFLSTMIGGLVSKQTGVDAPSEVRARNAKDIEEAERKLRTALEDLRNNASRAAVAMGKVGATDTGRGPMTPANPSPGADPKG